MSDLARSLSRFSDIKSLESSIGVTELKALDWDDSISSSIKEDPRDLGMSNSR